MHGTKAGEKGQDESEDGEKNGDKGEDRSRKCEKQDENRTRMPCVVIS